MRRRSQRPSKAPSSRPRALRRSHRTISPWRVVFSALGLILGLSGAALSTGIGRRAVHKYILQERPLTFPEGSTRFDMAKRLEEAQICSRIAFLMATEDRALLSELGIAGDSAEGYLFPATYTWTKNMKPDEVIRRMKREFDKRTAELFATPVPADAPVGWDTRARITLASVVEKEAQAAEERGLIAGVFWRRMTSSDFPRHVLESDPTAAYPCLRARELGGTAPAPCATFSGAITPALLHDANNAYSTYTHAGLPPGPICNPGLAALRAATLPEKTEMMFFVAKGGGRHSFSRTYDEHLKAIRAVR